MMKKLALGLLLALLACAPARAQVGPPNSILCNKTAIFTGTGAAATVITGVNGINISVCGWHITAATANGTFAITTGGGATCGTNTVNVTGTLNVSTNAPSADHVDFASWSAGNGNNVCVNATLTNVTGMLFYSQN